MGMDINAVMMITPDDAMYDYENYDSVGEWCDAVEEWCDLVGFDNTSPYYDCDDDELFVGIVIYDCTEEDFDSEKIIDAFTEFKRVTGFDGEFRAIPCVT